MSRKILKSNGAFVLIGDSPSWKTTNETGRLFSLVQNLSFGVANERQKLKQVGYENYAVNHINRAPNVNLTIDYYLSPYLNNELLLGFNGRTFYENFGISNFRTFKGVDFLDESFNDRDDDFSSNNFYVIINNKNGDDAISEARKWSPQTINFSGCSVLSFGNCYLTNYQLSFSVGSLPMVSTSYLCSNMKIDSLSGNTLTIPAINPRSGNANNAGTLNLANSAYPILSGYLEAPSTTNLNISKLPVASHRNSSFILKNLQIGGVALSQQSQPILQNLNINIDFERTDLYRLGSNYVCDRKLEFPSNATIDIQGFVSGFQSGFLSGMLNNENSYDFDIAFSTATNNLATGFYKFQNTKLENFNYSMQVNEIMNFSASFSVEMANETGFFIARIVSGASYWNSIEDLWSTSNIIWQ
jgi:hypothetical protein